MIRALLLIFDPANTWERIEKDQHSIGRVFFQFFLPVVLAGLAVEGFLLTQLGHSQGTIIQRVLKVEPELALRYGLTQLGLALLILFLGAWLFRKAGQGFHRQHRYQDCFATLAYSLSPYYLVRMLDGLPALNTWLCWGIGAFLAMAALYRGMPRIMKPDPSNALGVYIICCLVLLVLTGISHFLANLVLQEKVLII